MYNHATPFGVPSCSRERGLAYPEQIMLSQSQEKCLCHGQTLALATSHSSVNLFRLHNSSFQSVYDLLVLWDDYGSGNLAFLHKDNLYSASQSEMVPFVDFLA
ncbi:hypothetical protein Mapa_000339 [Marchantia paleacea]|nr:hypothetical protein Mapa_000339 [Marchantia paleacea]